MAVLLGRLNLCSLAVLRSAVRPRLPAPHGLLGACRTKKTWPVTFPPEELRKRLTPLQFHVTQERGTESAFRGELTDHKEEGVYTCVVCNSPLFKSDTKFDSGSGWPSFFDLMKEDSVSTADDFSYGIHRVETTCSQCGAHLGHLFDDGPRPTGKRYCINSASLGFQAKDSSASPAPPAKDSSASPAPPAKDSSASSTPAKDSSASPAPTEGEGASSTAGGKTEL